MIRRPPGSPLFPYTPLFRSRAVHVLAVLLDVPRALVDLLVRDMRRVDKGVPARAMDLPPPALELFTDDREDRKSTRLNSSHLVISYAVFCLKKKWSCSSCGVPGVTSVPWTPLPQPPMAHRPRPGSAAMKIFVTPTASPTC